MLATGQTQTVKKCVEVAFDEVGLDWEKYVKFDERYLRPTEVDALIGDYAKAESVLGWTPKVLPPRLAQIMVDSDVAELEASGKPYIDTAEV